LISYQSIISSCRYKFKLAEIVQFSSSSVQLTPLRLVAEKILTRHDCCAHQLCSDRFAPLSIPSPKIEISKIPEIQREKFHKMSGSGERWKKIEIRNPTSFPVKEKSGPTKCSRRWHEQQNRQKELKNVHIINIVSSPQHFVFLCPLLSSAASTQSKKFASSSNQYITSFSHLSSIKSCLAQTISSPKRKLS
jgi:hypothetical protein